MKVVVVKLPFVEFRSLAVGRNSGYSLYSPRDAVNALTVILNDSGLLFIAEIEILRCIVMCNDLCVTFCIC